MTQRLENMVDIFQWKILRQLLKIKWPKQSPIKHYTKLQRWHHGAKTSNEEDWICTVTSWDVGGYTGKKALREAQIYVRKPKWKTKTAWPQVIERDMVNTKVVVFSGSGQIKQLSIEEAAHNKKMWHKLTQRAMSSLMTKAFEREMRIKFLVRER